MTAKTKKEFVEYVNESLQMMRVTEEFDGFLEGRRFSDKTIEELDALMSSMKIILVDE